MSKLLNIQNAIRDVSQELIEATRKEDWDKVEELEAELDDLQDQQEEIIESEYNHSDWDDL